jgi:CBS domain-containing protein
MKIRDVMHTQVITLDALTSYEDAAQFLLSNNISGCPVTNGAGAIIGMISDKDLYKVLYPYYNSFYKSPEDYTDLEGRENKIDEIKRNPIERFMTCKVVSAKPDDPIMKVGGIMLARGIHRMPVINSEGKLEGIVVRSDIYQKIIQDHLK